MIKETFDKSRVINFSDAVFSIVMTLLILEVAVPTGKEITTRDFGLILQYRIPDFIGLLVSFLVSALYWIGHQRIMKYVTAVSGKLMWLNIFFLFAVVVLPFSTAMYVIGIAYPGPFIFYCLNLIVIGLFSHFMTRYVYQNEQEKTGFTRLHYLWLRNRGFNVIIVWILAALVSTFSLWTSRVIFVLLFVFQIFIDRYFKKKIRLQETS